jgi:hypothetical protein
MPRLSLPQNDSSVARQDELRNARTAWVYGCWEHLHCFAERVPYREMPRWAWAKKVIPGIARIGLNRLRYNAATRFGREHSKHSFLYRRGHVGASRLIGVPDAIDSAAAAMTPGRVSRYAKMLGIRGVDSFLGGILARNASGSAPSEPAPLEVPSSRIRRRPNVTIEDFKKIYQSLPCCVPAGSRHFPV